MRSIGFDLVLDFHGNLRSGVVGLLSGAKVRIGYEGHQQKEGNRLFTTLRVEPGLRRDSRMTRNLRLLAPLAIDPDPVPDGGLPVVPELDCEATDLVRNALGTVDRYVVISPGVSVSQAYKKPPPELLAAAAQRLQGSGIGVLVTHGPGEIGDAKNVAALAGGAATVAPPTSLPLLFHLIRNATAFIGGDTGPLHAACALGTPVLGLYGPTDPAVNAPWNVPCETVFPGDRTYTGIKKIDRAGGGFDGMTTTMVIDGLERLLARLPG
jgi:ADP-heptose:LPS heptosyltransferase